jgi:hypothetical protein
MGSREFGELIGRSKELAATLRVEEMSYGCDGPSEPQVFLIYKMVESIPR